MAMDDKQPATLEAEINTLSGRMASFFAKHGGVIGLAGGATLAFFAGATLMAGSDLSTKELVEANQGQSTALFIGGLLAMGTGAISQAVARFHLKGVDGLLHPDGEREQSIIAERPDARSSQKFGAEPINDEILSNPYFKRAMQDVFKQLEDDPKTRGQLIEKIQSSPEQLGGVLIEAQKHIEARDAFNEAKEREQTTLNPMDDQSTSGPSLH